MLEISDMFSDIFPDFPNTPYTVQELKPHIKRYAQIATDLYDDKIAEDLAKLTNRHMLESKLAYWKRLKINEEVYEFFKDKVKPEVAEIVNTLLNDRADMESYELFLTAELLSQQ